MLPSRLFDAGGWLGEQEQAVIRESSVLSEEPYTEREVIGASDCHILMSHQSGALPALTIYTRRHKHTEQRGGGEDHLYSGGRGDF